MSHIVNFSYFCAYNQLRPSSSYYDFAVDNINKRYNLLLKSQFFIKFKDCTLKCPNERYHYPVVLAYF